MMLHNSFEDGHSLKEQLDVSVHRSSNDVFAVVQSAIHRVAKRGRSKATGSTYYV
jgi:hypothetical protein